MDTRKYILWVEDFDSSSDLFEGFDDFDSNFGASSRETAQAEIRKTFPAYLHNHVEHISDPTMLPAHMALHHDDYALIILDVNLENGMPPEDQLVQDLKAELEKSDVILDMSCDFEKNLGYYLYTYFRNEWNIPVKRIVFNSAYVQKDGSEQALRILGSISPQYLEKNNEKNSLQKYLREHFPDTIDALSIVKAKDILAFWEEYLLNKHQSKEKINSVFSKAVANKPNTDAYVSFIEKIKSAFSPVSSEKQLTYWNILAALSHPFEAKPEINDWNFTVFQAIKQIRNICAHRDYLQTTSKLSHEEFLLLFTIGMRALFDDHTSPIPTLEAEKWIIQQLNSQYSNQAVSEFSSISTNEKGKASRVKELFISWYFSSVKEMKVCSLVPFHSVIANNVNEYSFSNILQMLCIKATGLKIIFQPQLSSNHERTKPTYQCTPRIYSYINFETEFHDSKFPDCIVNEDDAWNNILRLGKKNPIIELLLSYINNQLCCETDCPKRITINL